MPTTPGIETTTISETSTIDLDLRNESAKQSPLKKREPKFISRETSNNRKTVNRTLREQSPKQSTSTNQRERHNTLQVNKRGLVLNTIITIDVIGVFGNIFALVILHRKAMLELPGSLFLRTLTGTDLLLLLSFPMDLQLRNQYFVICKIGTFLSKTLQFFSKYITLSFSLERFIVICFPQHKHHGN